MKVLATAMEQISSLRRPTSGDLGVLVERGRRVLHVHLKDVDAGLAELARAIDTALE